MRRRSAAAWPTRLSVGEKTCGVASAALEKP
ncbi:Uncharacterised protein [Mycobacterium tuberculosis]|nr:Uncharacterised protein [Mycobacterium tuberculosis]